MPAPTVVVVFVDADGDEFPVSVPAVGSLERRIAVADERAFELIQAREWRPVDQLTYVRTEG